MTTQTVAEPAVVDTPFGSIAWRMITDRRRSIMFWSLGVALLSLIMAAAYPSIRDTGDEFDAYIESLPEGLQETFGLTGASIGSPEGYLTSQLYSNMYPIVLLILGIGLAAWIVAGSESDGTLEMALANPVTRVRLAVERILGMWLVVAWVTVVSTLMLVAVSPVFGLDEGLPWWALWSAGLQSYLFALVISALSFAVGAVSGSRGLAIAVGAAVAVLGFLLQALSSVAEILESARWASPWYWLLRDNPVVTAPNAMNALLPLALALVFAAVGVAVFNRRDLRLG